MDGLPLQHTSEVETIPGTFLLEAVTTPDIASTTNATGQPEQLDSVPTVTTSFYPVAIVQFFFASDSSGSNGSGGTYITCKMSELEEAAPTEFVEETDFARRESISEPLVISPSGHHNRYPLVREHHAKQ